MFAQELIDGNQLFSLNIYDGQNLNKVLKPQVIYKDLSLITKLIHRKSTPPVE